MAERKTDAEGGQERPSVRNTLLHPLALASQLGITMGLMTVSTVLAGLYLGSVMDRRFGTRPFLTLAFVLIGVLVGMLGTVHLAQSTLRELNAAAAHNVQPRTAFSARDLGRALFLVAQLALVTLAPIGLGLLLGLQLDQALGSRPIFTIALLVAGASLALVAVFFVSRRAGERAGPNS